MRLFLSVLGALLILATLAARVRRDEWWVRIFDFPRLQIGALSLVVLVSVVTTQDLRDPTGIALVAGLVLAIGLQTREIFPYTPLAPTEVRSVDSANDDSRVSLVVANVLMSNRSAGRLLEMIRDRSPDMVLALEPDAWWEEKLDTLAYPHVVSHPLDNRYGISLRSRLPLIEPELRYLVNEEIPSIHTRITLRDDSVVSFYGLHPEPPSPTEADESTERDAELLIVGRAAKSESLPVIVTGDLNDVAWSHTTQLFRRTSGLLDPRRGRGMFNTFHATIPLLRFPLDHIFHSTDFRLVRLERLRHFGSDHFPIYCVLELDRRASLIHDEPQLDSEERIEVIEKLEKVDPLDSP